MIGRCAMPTTTVTPGTWAVFAVAAGAELTWLAVLAWLAWRT